ncbi:MAG: SlyX family protein [Planctomycetes bacterium]|nr:SlyX family protein [Planctomycetota bacterium]
MSSSPDPDARIQSLEEHQLFLERQIEDLSSEVRSLGTLVHTLKSQLDHERDRLSKLSDSLHDKPQPDQH